MFRDHGSYHVYAIFTKSRVADELCRKIDEFFARHPQWKNAGSTSRRFIRNGPNTVVHVSHCLGVYDSSWIRGGTHSTTGIFGFPGVYESDNVGNEARAQEQDANVRRSLLAWGSPRRSRLIWLRLAGSAWTFCVILGSTSVADDKTEQGVCLDVIGYTINLTDKRVLIARLFKDFTRVCQHGHDEAYQPEDSSSGWRRTGRDTDEFAGVCDSSAAHCTG
jgi:hypothetical protein